MMEHNDDLDFLDGFEIIDPVTGQVLEKVEWPGMYEMINAETGKTGVIIISPPRAPTLYDWAGELLPLPDGLALLVIVLAVAMATLWVLRRVTGTAVTPTGLVTGCVVVFGIVGLFTMLHAVHVASMVVLVGLKWTVEEWET